MANRPPKLTMASTEAQESNTNCSIQDRSLNPSRSPPDTRQSNAIRATEGAHGFCQVDGTPQMVATHTMATPANVNYGETRRNLASPRPRGRENQKNIPCRNITIYGNCRYENEGCAFNHDRSSFGGLAPANANSSSVSLAPAQVQVAYMKRRNMRTRMNADSPSFTPGQTTPNGGQSSRSNTISPKAASAAIFTPKTNKSSKNSLWKITVTRNLAAKLVVGPLAQALQTREPQEFKPQEFKPQEFKSQEFKPQEFKSQELKSQEFKSQEFKSQEFKSQEFKPPNQNDVQQTQQPVTPTPDFGQQTYDQTQMYNQHEANAVANLMASYDPFTNAAMQGMAHSQQQSQLNPYAQDLSGIAGPSNFFNATADFQQPVGSSQVSLHFIRPVLEPPRDKNWTGCRDKRARWDVALNPEASAFVPIPPDSSELASNAASGPAAEQCSLKQRLSTARSLKTHCFNDNIHCGTQHVASMERTPYRTSVQPWFYSPSPMITPVTEKASNLPQQRMSGLPVGSQNAAQDGRTSLAKANSKTAGFGSLQVATLEAAPTRKPHSAVKRDPFQFSLAKQPPENPTA